MKKLIYCPNCSNKIQFKNSGFSVEIEVARPKPLGEITDEGFKIKRFSNHYTNIVGRDFAVVCNDCKEPVYIRKEESDRSGYWITRLSWIQAFGTFGTI